MVSIRVNSARFLFYVALLTACTPSAAKPPQDMSGESSRAAVLPQPRIDSLVALADKGRIEGSPSAKVWFVIISDFQCPYCKQWHDSTFEQIRTEYVRTGKVKVAYVNFPLNSHQHAWPSAHGAMCASEQGKFWPYANALFATQDKWAVLQSAAPVFDSIAQALRVNMKQWRECVSSERMQGLIRGDRDRATESGVNSTPSFLIGDKGMAGVHPIEDFRKVLDPAIAQAAGKASQ